jgi:superfamily II DNA or RNA helicase
LINIKTKDSRYWPEVLLRDYQKPIIDEATKYNEGVINATVGAGKTVLACCLTKKFGFKTTVLVPNTVLLEQFALEFKKWFNYDVGIVGAGKKNIKDITVATWQSLSADELLCEALGSQTSMLIIDEVQGICGKERQRILSKYFKPERLYGLSGSPRRSKEDGRTAAIFFLCGPEIAKYEGENVKIIVEPINSKENIPMDEYPIMIDAMVANKSRNKLVAGLAIGEAMRGKRVLVLTKRTEHCRNIMSLLPKSEQVWHASSDDNDRNDIIMEMRSGDREFQIIVGTLGLLGTGLDIPSLDVVILCGDLRSDVLVQQSVGRISRLFEGKEIGHVYDIFDYSNPILKNQYFSRLKFYKSKGWEIIEKRQD